MNEEQKPTSKREGRSPNFPKLTINQAIERTRTLYRVEKRTTASVPVVMKHWGYNSPSGGAALSTYAAVRAYGLLKEEGSGPAKKAGISDLAYKILLDERPDSPERREAVKKAALLPAIHKALIDKYKNGLPSDENLRHELIHERAFTPTGAGEFMEQFKQTIAQAGLLDSEGLSSDGEAETPDGEETPLTPPKIDDPPAPAGKSRTLMIPLSPSESAVLQIPANVTERAWKQMLTVLEAMKPGIVRGEAPDEAPPRHGELHPGELKAMKGRRVVEIDEPNQES